MLVSMNTFYNFSFITFSVVLVSDTLVSFYIYLFRVHTELQVALVGSGNLYLSSDLIGV